MPGALAADADMPVKAPAVAVVDTPWWTHGFVEVGGRGFLNNPTYGGHIYQGQGSLAKYYEYSTVKPGPFGDFNFAAGSKDGLYEIDAWGKNVGYNDQRYEAYLSKAGEQYFNFMWDQTPHVYSTSGSTLFNTNGNALTLINPNIGALISAAPGGAGFPSIPNGGNAAKTNAISSIINSNVVPTDVGIRRDTASVDYRYTPTDNWDIRANYSNMRQDRKPGRRRAFHIHKYRLSRRCRQAGRRYNAEFRRERRILGHVRLGSEVQRDSRL